MPESGGGAAFVTGGSGFIGRALIRRLTAEGRPVRALARSARSAEAVGEMGADPVDGDLDSFEALRAGAEGCELALHCAAHLGDWGAREEFERVNVAGTQRLLHACRAAGVRRFVHVGTEAALLNGGPLIDADEQSPLRPDSKALYSATKARAEQAVRAASGGGFETVVVRPRLVWGPDDTTLLPVLADAVRAGRFAWIGGGRHRTSTTHVDNVVEGLLRGAERGRPGAAYFVTDGEPVVFREFLTGLLATRGLRPPDRSLPRPAAAALAAAGELAWSKLGLRGQPPLTRLAYWVSGLECTLDTSRARHELGYQPVRTVEEGLAGLRRDG
jgi:nucleoside-diphosphate-sugar epimerase